MMGKLRDRLKNGNEFKKKKMTGILYVLELTRNDESNSSNYNRSQIWINSRARIPQNFNHINRNNVESTGQAQNS